MEWSYHSSYIYYGTSYCEIPPIRNKEMIDFPLCSSFAVFFDYNLARVDLLTSISINLNFLSNMLIYVAR